jgi:formylglycine-generating enzyme required for sulfatase activity
MREPKSQRPISTSMPIAPVLALGLALSLAAAGCKDEPAAPSVDATVVDSAVPDALANCKKSTVQCGSDEINAFGVCLQKSTMAELSAGTFTMGYTESGKNHTPEHKVTLKAFLIDKTEVSVAQYKACVDCGACTRPLRDGSFTGRQPYYGSTKYDAYPVIYVSWEDAKAYCEGIGKRLPTEAEWEMAARGTSANVYPWGSTTPTKSTANFGAAVNDTDSVTAYEKGKSPCGAYNMAGNVWEWVADSYDSAYYSKSPSSDPTGPSTKTIKVMRGGGFLSTYDLIATYIRGYDVQEAKYAYVGFRCAATTWQAKQ